MHKLLRLQEAPLPADYQTALDEILILRNKINVTNERWAIAVEKRVCDNRANAGTIRALQARMKAAKELLHKSVMTPGSDTTADIEDAMEILK